jgi:hypothetical protein
LSSAGGLRRRCSWGGRISWAASRRGRAAATMCLAAGSGRMAGEMAGARLDEEEKEGNQSCLADICGPPAFRLKPAPPLAPLWTGHGLDAGWKIQPRRPKFKFGRTGLGGGRVEMLSKPYPTVERPYYWISLGSNTGGSTVKKHRWIRKYKKALTKF